jgi:O-Antigen ligase/Tetratricopeptide repeat
MRTPILQRHGLESQALVAFLTGAPIVSLSAASGGFFPPAWGWATIGFALAAAAVLALADTVELGTVDVVALVALTSFLAWIALSLVWSESPTRTVLELQRALVYVAALAALLLAVRRSCWRTALAGVLVAVSMLALYGLATRLLPDVFGYERGGPYQLSRPVGYWNALGLLAAMGVVLALGWAAHARAREVRAAAAAAVPALVVTLYFTFSRGAWVGLVIALVVLFVFDPRRSRAAAVLVAILPFTAAAVALASQSDGLTRANAPLAQAIRDGHRLGLAIVLLCAGASVAASAVDRVGSELFRRPNLRPPAGIAALALGAVAAAGLLAWGGGPGALADRAYDAFVGPPALGKDDLNARLLSASGNSRADYWRVALETTKTEPLVGTGAGTFELSWYRDRPGHGTVRDAHNIYLEVLAELGPVGLALLVTALAAPLAALARTREPLAAAGGAAYVAYLAHAGLDWDWELPAVTLAAFGCAASVFASARTGSTPLRPGPRAAALAASGLVAAAGVAGYLGASALADSTSAFENGAYVRARESADDAVRLEPWSGHALIALGEAELALGDRDSARRAFRAATTKEPNDWYAWYELALASEGRERMRAIARGTSLNPLSPELAALRR